MLKKITVFLFAASVFAFAYSQKVNIIPAPASVNELNEEGFSLNQKTVLYIDTKGEEMEVAKFLQESFRSAFGTKLRIIDKKKIKNKDLKNAIVFVKVSDKTLKDEGYQMDINKDKIVVQANENAGFFYALQSICQLSEGRLLPGHLTLWQDEKVKP